MTVLHGRSEQPDDGDLASLCAELEKLLNSRAEIIVLSALQQLRREHQNSIRVVRSETGFSVYAAGQPKDSADLQSMIEKVSALLNGGQSLSEKLCLRIERHLHVRIKSASLHTGTGRIISTLLFRVLKRCSAQLDAGYYSEARSVLLACLLSEPEHAIEAMLYRNACMGAQFYSRRMAHLANGKQSERLVREFVWSDEADYRAVIAGDSSSRILLTIHMGDFTGAFKRISSHATADRTATTLKREDTDGGWSQLFANGGTRHSLVRHGSGEPLQIVSRLRRGGHTVAILADLKEDFGQTTEVQFLGRRARFVKGPAQLAVSGRACIYPFVTYQSGSQQHIEFAERITPELLPGENLPEAVNRITQQLVRLAEQWIMRSPDQWKFLSTLPGYFVTEDLNERQSVQA